MTNSLRQIQSFNELLPYLEEELDWPLHEYGFEDLTFEYSPAELGLKDEEAVKVKSIHQLRPLQQGQPWGIFFVEFENKKLPVVVLRRILSHLVIKKRASANRAAAAAWATGDLLFISAFGHSAAHNREIAFAHFHQEGGELPTLRVLGWDGGDTLLKLEHVAATLRDKLSWPEDTADEDGWRDTWATAFRHRQGHVIRTADALAAALAALARRIRDAALLLLAHEAENGQLRSLHKAFRTALIQDLSEADFADTYAQTITYGLLTAAISRTEMSEGAYGTALIADNVADIVPVTNPFLKEMLQTFLQAGGRKGGIDFDELGIQDVVELLRGEETDLPAVLRDFGNKTQGEDPVIHFYEHFLAAYDKQLKVQRGVFYTPKPVVSYIVRSVHELLQTEFGLADGLADTTTWGEMAQRNPDLKIPEDTHPDSPFVMILDPATGTATFLVEVMEQIYQTMQAKWQKAGLTKSQRNEVWNEYVPQHLLPRLYGYELMMAPYAIAHMKMGLKLYETGYRFASTERVRIYLTNALETSNNQQVFKGIIPALANEAEAVKRVKKNQQFSIVVGNPPYSVTSTNSNGYINELMSDYKEHVRGERGLVALSDDYLKFIRMSQEWLRNADRCVLGMITNHGYLKGIIHRGVRIELTKQFNELFILDLHGDSNIGELVPDGQSNENVFDIQQGVAISIGVKSTKKRFARTVKHFELWGTRQSKYNYLLRQSLLNVAWNKLEPVEPNFFLVPFDNTFFAEYQTFPQINDIMPVNSCGVKTHRDGLVIDFDKQALLSRMTDVATEQGIELLKKRYSIKDTAHWNLTRAKKNIKAEEVSNFIHPITYRPFDNRWIYYNPAIIEKGDSKFPTLRHMFVDNNLALLTARIQATGVFDAVFISDNLVEMKTAESSRSSTTFPLFLLNEDESGQLGLTWSGKNTNFSSKFLKLFSKKLGLDPNTEQELHTLTPRNILHYAYAVMYSPAYRTRYKEFLKVEFPRLPITSSLELFHALRKLGSKLTTLHLVKFALSGERDLPAEWAQYPRLAQYSGSNRVIEKFPSASKAWQEGYVAVNQSSGFTGIPEDVWNFKIGGYQVCHKWLKDRQGRTLTDADILHYCKIITAIHQTIRLMAQIDEVIEEHGSWPIQ